MDSATRNREAELHARVRQLERELQRIPSRTPQQLMAPVQVTVNITNNKLLGYGGLRGAVYSTTPLSPSSPLATAYDPAAPVAITDDGIAYGSALVSGSPQQVLIVNRPINDAGGNTVSIGLLSFNLPQTCTFLCYRTVSVPAPAATYITAYEAYWG